MKTPKEKIKAVPIGTGFNHYVGIQEAINRTREIKDKLLQLGGLVMLVSADGFQFYKSSKRVGWPLICSF